MGGRELIDGNSTRWEGTEGHGYARYPCEFIVELREAFSLREIRFRLFENGDNRFYRYTIDTSVDGKNYQPLVDRSKGEWRSWQVLMFPPRSVKFIRVKGLYNSANQDFHIVELEAYCKPNPNPPPK